MDCLEDIRDYTVQKHMDDHYKSTFKKIPTLYHIVALISSKPAAEVGAHPDAAALLNNHIQEKMDNTKDA